jgi:hypothetical protein
VELLDGVLRWVGTNNSLRKRPRFAALREELRAMSEFWTRVASLPEPPA